MRAELAHAYEWAESLVGISTGSVMIDRMLGSVAGFPRGRVSEVFGWESCLESTTYVHFTTILPDAGTRVNRNEPRVQNCKGGTIGRLYERFHRLEPQSKPHGDGRGKYIRRQSEGTLFYAPSVNDEGRIFLNQILNVVSTGERPCFLVTTERGHTISATAEHRFYTGDRYLQLADLHVGGTVMIHANTPYTGRANQRRKYLTVKHHPPSRPQIVRGKRGYENTYVLLPRSRAVVEASLNGALLVDYTKRLNAGDLDGLIFLPSDAYVHHRDENQQNDDFSNLQVMTPAEHGRHHHNNLRFEARPDVIVSIEPNGVKPTYDIQMAAPFNNFVASKFVVHNSSKTTICLTACAKAQREGLYAAYLDVEHGVDLTYANRLGFVHNDPAQGEYMTPRSFEDMLLLLDGLVTEARADIIIVDSVAALVPQAAMDGALTDKTAIAENARIFSSVLPRIAQRVAGGKTALVFVNQMRKVPNIGWTPHGAPTEQTSGGSALRFYSSLRLEFKQVKRGVIKRTIVDPFTKAESEESVVSLHSCKAFKNKTGTPYRTADFYLRIDPDQGIWGVDNLQSLIEAAIAHDIIESRSGGNYTYTMAGTEPIKARSAEDLYKKIRATEGAVVALKDAVFTKVEAEAVTP